MDIPERLAAIEDIRALKARYFRSVDTKDWDGLDTVFAEDIVFDRTYGNTVRDIWTGEWTPPLPPEPLLVHGREAVIAMVRRAVAEIATIHHGHMPEFTFDGHDTAHVIWAMSDELRDRTGRLILAGRGHYHDTCRRTAEGWRIVASRLTRLVIQRGDGQRP
ncbi:nuclear transport factor 2 family protein [Sphingomonas sp. ID0503]|uniref:nuclear transport factor 2 family protein n=1 Tax=Sphingomonas sp. ID0503 TaxID=3399691 RepID=UPI003AFAC686